MSDALTMYTTSWCGFCHRLKSALRSEGIAWTEVDIEADPTAAEFVGSVNGGNHVVTTFVEVEGAGDYLPPYAGNLDIMTAAATKVGEEIAKESLAATAGGGQA